MTKVGAAIVVTAVLAAVFGPALAPFDPADQQLALRLEGPTGLHWFGLHELGRDILARVLWGVNVLRLPAMIRNAFFADETAAAPAFYVIALVVILINAWMLARAGWDL